MSVPKTFLDAAKAPALLQDRPVPTPFAPRDVPGGLFPPPPVWVDNDDFLLVQCRNSLAAVQLQVSARLLLAEGRITNPAFTLLPTSDRTLNTAAQQLTPGYLIGAAVVAIGATVPTRGQTYTVLKLQRGPGASALNHFLLGADYLSGSLGLEWPYGRTVGAIEGPGILRSVLGTAPAAGAEWTQTVPTNARWRIRGVRVLLATGAAVANRFPGLRVDDGVNPFYVSTNSVAIVASSNFNVNWIPGLPTTGQQTADENGYMPPDLILFGGQRLLSSTTGLQAADAYGAPRFFVEEWIED